MPGKLKRAIKTPGAVLMGLGSIVGTGIFVSIAIATQISGNGVIVAIIIAAILAVFNGLSSAQLAAAHPVSGGTYEYGNRFMNSYAGFTAGWMFLIAKSASAATAVLGCIGYLFFTFDIESSTTGVVVAGILLLFIITYIVSGGIDRSNVANIFVVSFTLAGLVLLVISGLFINGLPVRAIIHTFTDLSAASVLYASALMFVAYTGYGRIATLGEEVANPQKTIPKAIILAMVFTVVLYLCVTLTALQALGVSAFGQSAEGEVAPLMLVARSLSIPLVGHVIAIAAITAMIGVLLNLLLGLSRVMLSMARRKDLPVPLAKIYPQTQSPAVAVWIAGFIIGLLVLSGNVVFTWSFSAFSVLIYYAITNASAFVLPAELRLYPRWIPVTGFLGCLFLAFWIDYKIWITGLAVMIAGLIWHFLASKNIN